MQEADMLLHGTVALRSKSVKYAVLLGAGDQTEDVTKLSLL